MTKIKVKLFESYKLENDDMLESKASDIQTLEGMIKKEIERLENDKKYWESDAYVDNEKSILDFMKEKFGFDYETDNADDAYEYISKATPVEVWKYHLDHTIDRINNKS